MITDGVFALPDASAVDSLLAQFRASTVCCSFIKVGSGFHAHCRLVFFDNNKKTKYTHFMDKIRSGMIKVTF